MRHFTPFRSALCATLFLLGIGSASAALIDRGGGLIYDTDINITWLQDARYAVTSGAPFATTDSPIPGYMRWAHAMDWVANLSYYDSVRNQTLSDWRLPTVFDTNTGELGHLFFDELGNTAFHFANTGPFINFLTGDYWYDTLYPFFPNSAWDFAPTNAVQGATSLNGGVHYAWAVRDGDVAVTTPIPEPETYAMMLVGLALLGFHARRRKLKLAA